MFELLSPGIVHGEEDNTSPHRMRICIRIGGFSEPQRACMFNLTISLLEVPRLLN
jgi:hypothetical protein